MSHPNAMHPKRTGSSVEAAVIDSEPGLEWVSDGEARDYDAVTTELLTPTLSRPFGGICVVESETPVEIKGCIPTHNHGRSGQWYIKRRSHEQLVEQRGVYWLVVYAPQPNTPLLSQLVVPAATVGDFLDGSWYDNGRREVAKLTWKRIIDEESLDA